MRTITVKTEELRVKLEENLTKHVAEYEEVYNLFRHRWATKLHRANDLARAGEFDLADRALNEAALFARPESHEKDYRTAIEMLEWHEGKTIDLTIEEFDQYVQDNWDWKHRWAATKSAYIATGISDAGG